jgi:hypothetical protein
VSFLFPSRLLTHWKGFENQKTDSRSEEKKDKNNAGVV